MQLLRFTSIFAGRAGSCPSLQVALLLALSMLLAAAGAAQTNKPTVVSEEPPRNTAVEDHSVPLLVQPLRLADFSGAGDGMEPPAPLAQQLTHIRNFVQAVPVDGKTPSEATEVWLGRTSAALYFVFVCHDSHPGLIRSHLARRENVQKDDTVSVLLDPFADHRRGVLFTVNPAGVQADAAWSENNDPDFSYDQVWESDARITRSGWVALIAIPYRSLRFPPGAAGWGVVFQRNIPRNSEQDFWPRIATNVSGVLTQEATLRGIEGVTGSHNFQLNPYALAQNVHTLNSLDPMAPYFSSRKLEGTAGGDVKAILKDRIVLDATINPDFSQVESDQPQFTINQRYPVYFPELRPFFLENANYFSTPINLLYTRNIVHPEFGVRATGKLGRTNLGLLAIDDRAPGEAFREGNPLFHKRALFAVGRVSQDLGKGSSVGLIYTDNEFGDSFNRVGGADFIARFNDHWTAQGQAVESATRGLSSLGSVARYAAGPASYLEISRNGHSFNLSSRFGDFSTGFVSQSGFIQSANIRSDSTHANYQWYPKHSAIQTYGVETQNRFAFDHQGNRVYRSSQADLFVALARNTILVPLVGSNSDTLTPAQYSSLPANRNFSENFVGFVFRSAPTSQVSFNIVTVYGGNVNYNPVRSAAPSLLHQNFVQATVSVQPFRSLTIDNTYLLDRDFTAAQGAFAFENQTLRTKINYQFTRAFSARVIVEYDSTLANPLYTSLQRTKQVSTQALLTWLPHPGTALYLGYNNDLQNLDRGLCTRGFGGLCDPGYPVLARSPRYLADGRQLFLKASYLLRF